MFEFCLKIVPVIGVAIFPIIFSVIYLLTGEDNFERIAIDTAGGMVLFTLWIWAVSFLFDFFKEWRKQRKERLMAQRELENWRRQREKKNFEKNRGNAD